MVNLGQAVVFAKDLWLFRRRNANPPVEAAFFVGAITTYVAQACLLYLLLAFVSFCYVDELTGTTSGRAFLVFNALAFVSLAAFYFRFRAVPVRSGSMRAAAAVALVGAMLFGYAFFASGPGK